MFMTLRRVVLGHLRVFLALAVVAVAWLLVPAGTASGTRAIIAWDIGVLNLLAMRPR
jgi:hypothetical protein